MPPNTEKGEGTDTSGTQHQSHAAHNSVVPPVGMILPGTVQVIAIAPQLSVEGQALHRWRITLRGVLQSDERAHDLADLECTLSFTTADESLIRQIRAQKYRYVLDLIQLQREGPEAGCVEDS